MFASVIIPILLFGGLVFFHELGHFTIAKLCNVYVERFAIGFGPAILKKRFGETEYAICLFPLGGYVKMKGEELPTEEDEDKNIDPRSFAAQNVWKRIAIVIMGPTSNFILPVIVYGIIFMIGSPTPSTMIGNIAPDSPAAQAGLVPGDRIEKVDGKDVFTWNQLIKEIQNNGVHTTELLVQRDGKSFPVKIEPKLEDDMNEYGEPAKSPKIGIEMVAFKPTVGISNVKSDAYASGLRTGDLITKVNDKNVTYWWQIENEIKKPGTKTIVATREDRKPVEFVTTAQDLSKTGIENSELYIKNIVEKSIAADKGLRVGDKIESVNGNKLSTWTEFRKTITKNQGEELILGIVRDGKNISINLTPNEVNQKNEVTQERKKIRQLGVGSETTMYPVDEYIEKYSNPFKAFSRGFQDTVHLTKLTFGGLGKLVTGKLSVNTLGGPISIFYMAGSSYEAGGWHGFFKLMALLSITLAALNILPVPVLDGGHLLFFFIEAIKGSPVGLKVRQMAMQVGFYLLMGLMVLVFYVDINRFFVDKIKALF